MSLRRLRGAITAASVALLAGCGSASPQVPYPAFLSVDELPDLFIAGLPGVRAKPLAGANSDTLAGGYRIDLPSSWEGTSGASPDKSLEIFVIEGELTVADIDLKRGGYAYLPPGTLGFNLKSSSGARVLYFLDDVDRDAVIRTPLILESSLLDWEPSGIAGIAIKELRSDPGSGARSWLLRVEPQAEIPWASSNVNREGYFVVGNYTHSECVDGKPVTDTYYPGGYVYRAADAIHGGPDAGAASTSIWFYRELSAGKVTTHDDCEAGVAGY